MSEPSPRDATGSSDATRPRPPHLGPPRPRTRPGSRAWGGRGGRPRESPPRVSSGTPCTCVAPFRARRCFLLRTPCSRFAAFRARRCSSPRTPCTGFAASRARRCSSPRTPCTGFAASRARRCSRPRTPCTGFAASRARRSLSPGTPYSSILGRPSRAGTSDLVVPSPSPSAVACRDSSAWRLVFARSVVASPSVNERIWRAFYFPRTDRRRAPARVDENRHDLGYAYAQPSLAHRRALALRGRDFWRASRAPGLACWRRRDRCLLPPPVSRFRSVRRGDFARPAPAARARSRTATTRRCLPRRPPPRTGRRRR